MENFGLLLEQANSGDAISQYKVGRAYESGDGVEKNINTAIMWYQKAADNGYKNANAKLQLLSIKKDSEAPKTAYQAPAAPETPKTTYQAPAAPKISTAANTQSNTGNSKTAQNPSPTRAVTGQKDKTTAALLAIFLGCFGAHDFYLGYKKQGITKILFTITIIGAIASYFLSVCDFIKIICNGKLDSDGNLLK